MALTRQLRPKPFRINRLGGAISPSARILLLVFGEDELNNEVLNFGTGGGSTGDGGGNFYRVVRGEGGVGGVDDGLGDARARYGGGDVARSSSLRDDGSGGEEGVAGTEVNRIHTHLKGVGVVYAIGANGDDQVGEGGRSPRPRNGIGGGGGEVAGCGGVSSVDDGNGSCLEIIRGGEG